MGVSAGRGSTQQTTSSSLKSDSAFTSAKQGKGTNYAFDSP